ncbi:YdcH family protein [Roseobacteraceae bacterium NS-SX3]
MSLSSHLTELKKKHEHLSMEVEQAQRAPSVDGLKIAEMKKQKLKLKEEIERLSSEQLAV